MKSDIDFTTYQSPFSWRYGSDEMRQIFSEVNKRQTWRQVWVALAKAQNKLGLVSKKELDDIANNKNKVDIKKAHEIEAEIKHDLAAELKTFAIQAKIGGGKIHLGATSQDIEDNADVINFKKALALIEENLKNLVLEFAKKIRQNKNLVCMGYTHLQPAEPTTVGYRFSLYAQDLLLDLELLRFTKKITRGKGFKGAVGTYASYYALLGENAQKMEEAALTDLELEAFTVSGQVYPRKMDYLILFLLSSIAQSLFKFAQDVRIMQSPGFGEWMEPFSKKQVGSSAMPFKRNPITCEKICSLSRYIKSLAQVAWDNAANSNLERTLDDSAARRLIIPDSFLATDEILSEATKVIKDLVINKKNIAKNLQLYGSFSGTEKLMMKAVTAGANRGQIHEVIRRIALVAWYQINSGHPNPLKNLLKRDKIITKFVLSEQIPQLLDPAKHTGLAQKRCALFLRELDKKIS